MQGTPNERSKAAIARRLKITREGLGYGGRQQAKFAQDAGIATNTYNQWEKGSGRPQLDEAYKLVDHYGITLDWIYLGDQRRVPFEVIDELRKTEIAEQARRRR